MMDERTTLRRNSEGKKGETESSGREEKVEEQRREFKGKGIQIQYNRA
jgi:hypothetical protein